MSFRQFLNSRAGFAGIGSLVCGTSYFLGVGLAQDASIREERKQLLESMIEERVQERLKGEAMKNERANGSKSL